MLLFWCLKRIRIVVELQSAIDNAYILEPVEIFIHQTCTTGPNMSNQLRMSSQIFVYNFWDGYFSTQAAPLAMGLYRARLGPEDHLPCNTQNKDTEQNVHRTFDNSTSGVKLLEFLRIKIRNVKQNVHIYRPASENTSGTCSTTVHVC